MNAVWYMLLIVGAVGFAIGLYCTGKAAQRRK